MINIGLSSKKPTIYEVLHALNFVSSDCLYDVWIKYGMAIHSWDNSYVGFGLWDNWSSKSSKYKHSETITHWKSFKSGGINIGTLFYEAKANGWTPKEYFYNDVGKYLEPAQHEEEIDQKFDNFLYAYTQISRPAPSNHPYLAKKHVKPHDLHVMDINSNQKIKPQRVVKNALVVPMYTIINAEDVNEGSLNDGSYPLGVQSLQFIYPNGFKMNYPGRKVSDCFYMFYGSTAKIYLCEGWATGASLYEETGSTVAVCFSCINLPKAAISIKRLYPEQVYPNSKFIVAADNNEIGMKCGQRAAELISATLICPPTKDTDFNDYFTNRRKNE